MFDITQAIQLLVLNKCTSDLFFDTYVQKITHTYIKYVPLNSK